MIPVNLSSLQSLFRFLQEDSEEAYQVERQSAQSYSQNRWEALRQQATELREKAQGIGMQGWFGFFQGLLGEALSSFKPISKSFSFLETMNSSLSRFRETLFQSQISESDQKIKDQEVLAEINRLFFEEHESQAQRESQRAQQSQALFREVRQEWVQARETTLKL